MLKLKDKLLAKTIETQETIRSYTDDQLKRMNKDELIEAGHKTVSHIQSLLDKVDKKMKSVKGNKNDK